MKVAPSILSADFSNLLNSIKQIEDEADLLHIDVMDGVFVPNITIGPVVIKDLKNKIKLPFDVHLMIVDPLRYIDDFINAGADYLTIHYEACKDPVLVLKEIRKRKIKAGISLKPQTKVSEIKHLLEYVDLVLVMSVEPGFGGQQFMESSIEKIKELKLLKKDYHYEISVDGGINNVTALKVSQIGADILVAGNYIFKNANPIVAIRGLKGK